MRQEARGYHKIVVSTAEGNLVKFKMQKAYEKEGLQIIAE